MKIPYDPHPLIDGYISIQRNMFLTSSIGIAMMGFSNNFKEYKKPIKIIALIIFLYSILYGYNASKDSIDYINYIKKKKNLPEIYIIMLNKWKKWILSSYIYIIITLCLSGIIFTTKIYI